MFTFEITSYPELPCDFALFGAREWVATDEVHIEGRRLSYAELYPHTLEELQQLVELAGITVPDLLGMVARGHLTLHYNRPVDK